MMFFSWSDPRRASLTCTPVPLKYALVSSSCVFSRPCYIVGRCQRQVWGLNTSRQWAAHYSALHPTSAIQQNQPVLSNLHHTVVWMHENM